MLCQYLTCHTKLFLWKYIMIFHMKCESQWFSCTKPIIFTFIELMKACEPCMNLLRHNSGTYHEHIISFDFRVLVVLSCHLKATSKKYRYVQQKVLTCDFFYTAVCRYVWAHLNSIPWRRRSLWRLSCLLFTNRLTIGLGIEVFHPCLVSLAQ